MLAPFLILNRPLPAGLGERALDRRWTGSQPTGKLLKASATRKPGSLWRKPISSWHLSGFPGIKAHSSHARLHGKPKIWYT